ncbi:MAG: hypothetical protein ACLUFH_13640 [Monoglobales bacterium]|uniref:hypothetical protein n=1 Tax=Candidatus Ventrimonas sp. TaxID=3048889 RepID=UPI003A3ED636
MAKMKTWLILGGILLLLIAIYHQKNMGQNQIQEEIERLSVSSERITDVNFLELTENNLILGIDYRLSREEIQIIQNNLKNKDFQLSKEKPNVQDSRYLMYLYNKEGEELACFMVDSQDRIYLDSGYRYKAEEIAELIKKIVSQEQKN